MLPTLVSLGFAALALPLVTVAQTNNDNTTILAEKRYDYPNLPYKVDTATGGARGAQFGYNICNTTTENQDSLCQTGFINSVDDFCLWLPPAANSSVGDVEGEMVAWCTKPGKGTRLIPPGAIQGVQFTRTPHYSQVVGFIDQTMVNVADGDTGGEMDPHGADNRGNPLGSLVFTSSFGKGNFSDYKQVIQWHLFVGSNTFCFKACDPSYDYGYRMCEHIYDRIGCAYNAPASYAAINGTFQTCLGDDQLPPGIYVGENNITSTYTQPPESLGVITTIPYIASIPSSSSCTTFASAALFSANTLSTTRASATPTSSRGSSSSGSATATSKPSSASGGSSSAAATSTSRPSSASSLTAGSIVLSLVGCALITLLAV